IYALDPAELGDAPASLDLARANQAVSLMALLEYAAHPLRPQVATAVADAARRLRAHVKLVDDAPLLAHHHFRLVYMDLMRQSWYRSETVKESLAGRARELLRSKLAYEGLAPA